MSFDVNVGRTRPMISPTSRMGNDGGSSGNTGYMARKNKKKQANSIFDTEMHNFSSNPFASEMDSLEIQGLYETQTSWLYKLLQSLKKRIKTKAS